MYIATHNSPLVVDETALMLDMEAEIAAGERLYQQTSKRLVHMEDGKLVITDEAECLDWIERIEHLAQRIASGHEMATEPRTSKLFIRHHDRQAFKLTALGRVIRTVCREALPLIEQASPGSRYKGLCSVDVLPEIKDPTLARPDTRKVRFNPYIAVMLRACQRVMLSLSDLGLSDVDADVAKVRDKLHWLLRFVRRVCHSASFKRWQANRTKLQEKVFKSCCRYMTAGLSEHSRLLVLRVDLYIRPEHKGWADTRMAEQCIKRYRRALSENHIVPDVIRHICVREDGFDRGVHYHLLVALDGHKHRSASFYSRLLGDAWVKRCGPMRASYFNCYVRRNWYQYNGLGSVHVRDCKKLIGMREAIRYMVKGDGYVMSGYKRNLWRGIISKDKQPKRGAPRRCVHDMSLVNSLLGNATYAKKD